MLFAKKCREYAYLWRHSRYTFTPLRDASFGNLGCHLDPNLDRVTEHRHWSMKVFAPGRNYRKSGSTFQTFSYFTLTKKYCVITNFVAFMFMLFLLIFSSVPNKDCFCITNIEHYSERCQTELYVSDKNTTIKKTTKSTSLKKLYPMIYSNFE